MPHFFATTPRGLESVLEKELHDLGIVKTKRGIAGVAFSGNWADCYRANLHLSSASRVLYPVLDFPAYEPDHIYHNVLKHDFTKYIDPTQTIAMDSSVRDSIIRDLRIVSLKAKDAVVDQFRKKFGTRPDVDTKNSDLQISLRLVKNKCTVSIDTSGGSLHMRGYRTESGDAPLKENLAASLVKLSEWDRSSVLLDPMCGSGTICIEAALMALRIPPGSLRRQFGFQKWKTFQSDAFKKIRNEISNTMLQSLPFKIRGYDHDKKAIAAAIENSENAGTQSVVHFQRQALSQFRPPEGISNGTIVTNPPYGERMGNEADLVPLYEELGAILKNHFHGWRAFVLTSSRLLTQSLQITPEKKYRVFNGAIECEFVSLLP